MIRTLSIAAGFLAMAIFMQRTSGDNQVSRRNAVTLSVKQDDGQNPIERFAPLASDNRIKVKVIPQARQRYDTEGDWWWDDDTLEIRLSAEVGKDDPRYEFLLLTHEFVEAMLCRSRGITNEQVDAFDMSFKGSGEPGDDPVAPYHREHQAAEAAERALAGTLGVDWRSYLSELANFLN
jgi:hypothetical protein